LYGQHAAPAAKIIKNYENYKNARASVPDGGQFDCRSECSRASASSGTGDTTAESAHTPAQFARTSTEFTRAAAQSTRTSTESARASAEYDYLQSAATAQSSTPVLTRPAVKNDHLSACVTNLIPMFNNGDV
jgi:hypothetical protein